MTFEDYVFDIKELDYYEVSQDELNELYTEYCNSEYYNGEKGL